MKRRRHFLKNNTEKTKNHSKTQLHEENLPFHDALGHFIFLCFCNACQVAFALPNKR